MNIIVKISLILLATISSTLNGARLCKDVSDAMNAKKLTLRLETTEQWYVPGEIVQVKLIFTNNSQDLIGVPADPFSLVGFLEYLNPSTLPDGDVVWVSVVSHTYAAQLGERPICDKTKTPRILQPGESFNLELSDLEFWRSGREDWSTNITQAPDRVGPRRIRFTSGSFAIDGTIIIKQPKSIETVCLAIPSEVPGSVRCRLATIVGTGEESVILLATNLSPAKNSAQLNSYVDYLRRRESALNPNSIHPFSERIAVQMGKARFEQAPASRVASKSISVVSGSGNEDRLILSSEQPGLIKIQRPL